MTANNTIKPAAVQSSTATNSAFAADNAKKDNKQYYPSNNIKQDSTTTSTSKPTIKISNSNTNSTNNNNVQLYTSSNIKLLHQRTSLSLAYDTNIGWNYVGETSLYVIAQQQQTGTNKEDKTSKDIKESTANKPLGNGDNRPIELALHLRDSCQVNSINIYGVAGYSSPQQASDEVAEEISSSKDEDVQMQDVEKDVIEKEVLQTRTRGGISKAISKIDEVTQSTTDQPTSSSQQPSTTYIKDPNVKHKLTKLPQHTISYTHHDPLSIVMKRFANLHNVEDDGNIDSSKRYEADAHATRGTKGITNSIRAASVASSIGELRVNITSTVIKKENKGSRIRLKVGGGRNTPVDAVPAVEDKSANKVEDEKTAETDLPQLPQSQVDATQCWKDDLLYNSFSADNNEDTTTTTGRGSATGETVQGVMEYKMNKEMMKHRCQDRKVARIDLIAKSMGGATSCTVNGGKGEEENKEEWSLSPAMKIVIRFSLRHPNNIVGQHVNLGGIHFISPSSPPTSNSTILQHASLSTPHVYTTPGTHGDHQGIRSWLPTLDSASPNHRCSHELTIKLTCKQNDGLWPVGSGEDFGYNSSVKHPILGNDCSEIIGPLKEKKTNENSDRYQKGVAEVEQVWNAVNCGISNVMGVRHARFINDFFYGDDGCGDVKESEPQDTDSQDLVDSSSSEINMEMVQQIRHIQPSYVTSIFSSLTWLPCPSRSLGFAIGPFSTLYDPEYFRLDHDNDDDSDSEIEEDDANDDNGPLSLQETAQKLGEGIRQLYFAPKEDRKWIHSTVTDELIFGYENETGNQRPARPELSTAQLQERRLLEGSVLASTIGVPNRALSLMRDVLALPAYRTSSYTQIWIPNAYMSGDNCGGNMVGCPEVGGCNSFLGGAIMDSTLLPPPGMRLPYYDEGRSLQFLQARNCIRGWTRAALALGGDDDVGQGYLHTLIESFLMSLYERGHGAFGEGGGKGSFFYMKRYAIGSGLNSPNLDFLPLVNIEDDEVIGGSVGVTAEEGGNEHLWRSANNGTETHTSALDEFAIEQLQAKDFIEAMERATERPVPLPSSGWQGSHQSATFLSHNSASSTALGCGALDFVHPMGGQMYRTTKAILLSKVYEGRAGMSNFTRVVRAAFIASFLRDVGVSQLKLPEEEEKGDDKDAQLMERPPFVICVDEMIKKQSISHAIFTRALRVISGPVHEVYLRGNLIDIGRDNYDSKMQRKLVAPEGFPNSYVRGASGLYLRVGAHIESADGSSAQSTPAASSQSAAAVKGIHLHVVAEPCIPEGSSIFGGPVTLRVIENEGQCREFIKTIPEDGSRIEWGPVYLHARPVSTAKQQQAASGISETPSTPTTTATSGATNDGSNTAVAGGGNSSSGAFTNDFLHKGGYQALELIRITNVTPLLWVRVDPHGLYNGRLNICQQDACLAEQLFHDGDAASQVEAIRALAERPLKVQGTLKITNVHDVPITELPVRVLGDCLRGSVALHCDLPHNPAVRAQAALAIAQWQNNKAPESKYVLGGSAWLGLNLLLQYFKERFYCDGTVLPVNFRRLLLHKHIAGGGAGTDTTSDGGYQYLDTLIEKDERRNAIGFADEIEIEEDEEYRVRSACVTAIASIRAQDGMTPDAVLQFLEDVLLSGDKAAVGSLLLPHEEEQLKKKQDQALDDEVPHGRRIIDPNDQEDVANLPYVSLSLVADALLALCYVNVRPQSDFDPTAGRPVKVEHPILPLMELCLGWLEWDLERMRIRAKANISLTGVGDACFNTISPCAITALCHMSILKQRTAVTDKGSHDDNFTSGAKRKPESLEMDKTATAQFYIDIFDDELVKSDAIKAAAAQSIACICCASDRNEAVKKEPIGLLVSLEFMLDRILGKLSRIMCTL